MRTCERQSRDQENLKRSLQGAGVWSDLEGGSGFGQSVWRGLGLLLQLRQGEEPVGASEGWQGVLLAWRVEREGRRAGVQGGFSRGQWEP